MPESNVGLYDVGAIYSATADGACNFGEVFTTDGRIKALNLTVLEDDVEYFPSYNMAPVINGEFYEQYPQVADVMAQIAPLLTDEVLMDLNYQVDVEGGEPADVAFAGWSRKAWSPNPDRAADPCLTKSTTPAD